MTTRLTFALVALTACALPACSSATSSPAVAPVAAEPRMARNATPCDAPLPVRDGEASWTVEGFEGGGDRQLLITKRRPVKRCSPAVVQSRLAQLERLR